MKILKKKGGGGVCVNLTVPQNIDTSIDVFSEKIGFSL